MPLIIESRIPGTDKSYKVAASASLKSLLIDSSELHITINLATLNHHRHKTCR
jgi:hypothetical protein